MAFTAPFGLFPLLSSFGELTGRFLRGETSTQTEDPTPILIPISYPSLGLYPLLFLFVVFSFENCAVFRWMRDFSIMTYNSIKIMTLLIAKINPWLQRETLSLVILQLPLHLSASTSDFIHKLSRVVTRFHLRFLFIEWSHHTRLNPLCFARVDTGTAVKDSAVPSCLNGILCLAEIYFPNPS